MLSSVNSCQKWQAVTFPPNGLIWVTGRDPKGLLEKQGNNMIYPGESWFEVNWQRYLVAKYLDSVDGSLDVGSMDDVVSGIRNSLVFHFWASRPSVLD